MMYIAENLRSLRKGKNITQEDAAEMLGVSPQSVSKWERGETMPDIALLPSLANFYETTVDNIIGMDKIKSKQTRSAVFTRAHDHMRSGEINAAVTVYSEALKVFPGDDGIMSDLAMALALCDGKDDLTRAVSFCERVLAENLGEKVHHTTRAALCFIYLKAGEKEKAAEVAKKLPHIRESREIILAQMEKNPSAGEIDSYIKFIAIGESDEQDVIEVDFSTDMVPVCTEHGLLERIETLRNELNAPFKGDGYRVLPLVRIRDKTNLPAKRVRVRRYADYILDADFESRAEAADKIIEALRQTALANIEKIKMTNE